MDLRYYADFKDRANNSIRLEIYVVAYVGTPEELLMQSDAISIEYQSDSLFDPLKPSKAEINMWNTYLKTDLYSAAYNSILVKIYKNTDLIWTGNVTPNIYTQQYKDYYDPITIECIDFIAQLSNVEYSSNNGITSLLDVIGKCLEKTDTNSLITTMYVDKGVKIDNNDRVLENLYIEERNFYDEKMEAAKCNEVVDSILKCLGMTIVQYKDAYYIVEQGNNLLSSYTLNKYEYSNGSWSYSTTETLALPVKTSLEIGIGEGNGQISLDNVYNKVTVISNNNPLDALLPDFTGKDDLVNQNTDQQHYEYMNYTQDDVTYKLLAAYFNSDNNWDNYPMYENNNGSVSAISEMHLSTMSGDNGICSMVWNKSDEYNIADGDPSSLNWKTYLTISNWAISSYTPYLELNKKPTMIFDGGYLIINMKYKLSTSRLPHSVIKSKYENFQTHGYYDKTWSDSVAEVGASSWPVYTMFPCMIKIGSYYYNGESWISESEYTSKVAWWNTIYYAYEGLDMGGHTRQWYRIWNTTHSEWEYVNQTQYNSFSGTKETGDCVYAHARYTYRRDVGQSSGDEIYYPDEFYYQRYYGNLCFLIRKNKAGDQIMDTEYELTNTVSYTMNIINASDGMAIKIDRPLYGELQFRLFGPMENIYGASVLGTDPQYQSSKPTGICRAVHISDLVIKYQNTSSYQDIFNSEDINPDTIYSNVINTDYCKEMDDIKLTVNTANDWAHSYSYLIKETNNGYEFIYNLKFRDNTVQRPEEKIVDKYVKYYSTPRYQYGNTLKNNTASGGTELWPFQPLTETLNGITKTFITNSITYNISANTANIIACEI